MMFFLKLKRCLAGLLALALLATAVSLPARAEEEGCARFGCIKFGVNWKTATVADVGDVDVKARVGYERTALMLAAQWNDDPEVIRALLAAGADVNARSKGGGTVLMSAFAQWSDSVYPNLYPKPNPEIVRVLLEAGVDVNARTNRGWFFQEIFAGLEKRKPYGGNRWTALMYAARTQNAEVVRLLLDAGAEVDARSQHWRETALMMTRHNHTRHNDNDGAEIALALLDAGADVNAKERDGTTALMLYASKENTQVLRALLEAGAEINARDNEGRTALMEASGVRNVSAVIALLEAGADVNARDGEGQTALIRASEYGYASVALALLEAGADINLPDNNGQTALMHASQGREDRILGIAKDYTAIIHALLEAGADVKAEDNEGKTAWDYIQYNPDLMDTPTYRKLRDSRY